jgi:CAAD domains of cyanobacterial aminoacyl-tRNA synthetase
MHVAGQAAFVTLGFCSSNFTPVRSSTQRALSCSRTVSFRTRVTCQVCEGNVEASPRRTDILRDGDARHADVPMKVEELNESSASATVNGEGTFSTMLAAGMQAVLEDLLERPDYYVNAFGALLATFLAYVILSTTIDALNHLPVIPDFLRLVGLLYSMWFMITYTLSPVARKELTRDVDEFVEVVVGGGTAEEG